jgi:hypothetical protein
MDPNTFGQAKDVIKEILPLAGPSLALAKMLYDKLKATKDAKRETIKAREETRKEIIKARHALLDAVESTAAYLTYLQGGGERSSQRELLLTGYWRTASAKLYQIAANDEEAELARRLRLKASAWEHVEQWPDERIKEAGIDFESVRSELARVVELPPRKSSKHKTTRRG